MQARFSTKVAANAAKVGTRGRGSGSSKSDRGGRSGKRGERGEDVETWVQCCRCLKWRRCPGGQFVSAAWSCRLNTDVARNHCGAPQERLPPGQQHDVFYLVDCLLGERWVGGRRQYLVRWRGYSSADDTWEDECSIVDPLLIASLHGWLMGLPAIVGFELGQRGFDGPLIHFTADELEVNATLFLLGAIAQEGDEERQLVRAAMAMRPESLNALFKFIAYTPPIGDEDTIKQAYPAHPHGWHYRGDFKGLSRYGPDELRADDRR